MTKHQKKLRILKKEAERQRLRYKGQPTSIASTLKEIMAYRHKEQVTNKQCLTALNTVGVWRETTHRFDKPNEDFTVVEIKTALRERDLPLTGKKTQLVERLVKSMDC